LHYKQVVTPARQGSHAAAVSPEYARNYVQRLVRDGSMDLRMATFQLQTIDAAARAGRPILIVEDIDPIESERRLTHAA
jgi:hypothetical protein